MKLHLLIATAFVAASLSMVAPAAAEDPCVQYWYEHHGGYHHLCVDSSSPNCPVYATGGPADIGCIIAPIAPVVVCAPYAYEHHGSWHEVCADSSARCPVYATGGPAERYLGCIAVTAAAGTSFCIPTNGGGLDYHSYLCVDAGSPKCAVYTFSDGMGKVCVPHGLLP